MNTTTMDVNGVRLAVETFGEPADPAILLIGPSLLWWPEEFCRGLGGFVIRYDPRDCGRSAVSAAQAPPYTLRDLVADAAALPAAFGARRAHVAGLSTGGWIAQLLALDHPALVASLTLIATRPTAPGPADPDLPEHAEHVMAYVKNGLDWSDRRAVVEHLVGFERIMAGAGPFDEDAARRRAERHRDPLAATVNLAYVDHGARWRERLGEISVPTLVVHGEADPFFPIGNGEALAREIPSARLLAVPGAGHVLPRQAWEAIATHLIND
ncbi:alpha/beta fold hydrolase [Nonomuraea sp. NPDC059194]|uniref:alpha/beta fold hydrolase n=1 Tax=Nonomuraea sp. NPDC059194 TaxID=3346764 RepID=UPI0036AED0DF